MDFSIISQCAFEGSKVLEAYQDPNLDPRVACKMDNGKWGLLDMSKLSWYGAKLFDWSELSNEGWGQVTTFDHLMWKDTGQVKDKEPDKCICDIKELMRSGCPVDRTGRCKSRL